MTDANDTPFKPEDVLRPILREVYVSDAGIDAFLPYFATSRTATAVYNRLSNWLGLADPIAERRMTSHKIQLSEADTEELITFRQWYQQSAKPDGFHWALFDADLYNGGTPLAPKATPTPPTADGAAGGDLPTSPGGSNGGLDDNGGLEDDDFEDDDDDDANEAALAAALAAATNAQQSTAAKSGSTGRDVHAHASYANLPRDSGPNVPHFGDRPPAGTKLAPHPVWTVQTAAHLAVDKSGFSKADTGTLKTLEPQEVIHWYQLFQLTAAQYGVHVVPFNEFDPDKVCFPTMRPGHITAMNTALVMKLTQPGVLVHNSPDLLLDYNHFLVRGVNESLAAYDFLHAILSQVATAVDNRGLPIPPSFTSTDGLLNFTSKLMEFIHNFGKKAAFTDRQATIHFLDEVKRHGYAVTKERDALLALDQDSKLPPHLEIKAVYNLYKRQTPPEGTVHRTRADTARQQSQNRDEATERRDGPKKTTNPFYHPVPGAVCEACNRRGHKAETCITLARFATTMAYYQAHPDLSKRLAQHLKTYYAQAKSNPAVVKRIQAAFMDGATPADEDDTIMAWFTMMPADF